VSVEVDEPDRSWSIVGDHGEYLQKERKSSSGATWW
jgi:hypothetical protein